MNQEQLRYALHCFTIPEEMAEQLKSEANGRRKKSRILRYSRAVAAVIACVTLLAVGTTSYAAYHVYQIKNLRVFFEPDATDEQIKGAEEILKDLGGVSSVKFVMADDAWEEFQNTYFEGTDIEAEFDENPLKDSYNYKVAVQLSADTKEIRADIENIDGVRSVCDLTEL